MDTPIIPLFTGDEMLPFILITLEINECLLAAMHAGISMVSFIMVSLFVNRYIMDLFEL